MSHMSNMPHMSNMSSLNRCPDELLLAIFIYLPASDLAGACTRVSRRFHRLANDSKIWHGHCCTEYHYWNEHDRALLNASANSRTYYGAESQPWKAMWLRRKRGDTACARHFEHVISSKVGRSHHMSAICKLQLDAKDFLQREYRAADQQVFAEFGEDYYPASSASTYPPTEDKCLARRYYASMAVSSINRSLAIEEWIRVRNDTNRYGRLDRALAAFDMFSILDAEADMDSVSQILDHLTRSFIKDTNNTHGRLSTMTVREVSTALVVWLHANNLVGMIDAEERYRDIRNCLIGQALTGHPDHPSLPLVSSAIFACIGQRIGLPAFCVAVPGHVYTTVLARPGLDVDGRPRMVLKTGKSATATASAASRTAPQQLPDNGERIFFDPYRHSHELFLQQLRNGVDILALDVQQPALVTVDEVSPVAMVGQASATIPMDIDGNEDGHVLPEPAPPLQPRTTLLSRRDSYLLPTPTVSLVLRLALNIKASWDFTMQNNPEHARHARLLHRFGPNGPCISTSASTYISGGGISDGPAPSEQAYRRYRCGSHGDPHADMEKMTYASAWAMLLMRPTSDADWEQCLDRLMSRFAHEYSEDAWIIEKYLLPIHDKYIKDAVEADPQGRHARGRPLPMPFGDPTDRGRANAWTSLRNMLQLVKNLDTRQPCVMRRYTQDIVENVRYKVGQVIRHKRFGFVGIIDGWAPHNHDDLTGPATVSSDEFVANFPTSPTTSIITNMKPYYSVMRTGVERRVVAQHNIEVVTDPRLVPPELMFLAGKVFKRFDYATCTFESNLVEFFPDD